MRIESSAIALSSKSNYIEKNTKEETLKMWIGDNRSNFEGDKLSISEEGNTAFLNQAKLITNSVDNDDSTIYEISDKEKLKISMIEKMLEALTGKKVKIKIMDKVKLDNNFNDSQIPNKQIAAVIQQRQGWGLEYDLHQTHYEKQTMSFNAAGVVKTADGREINISTQLNMSRELASRLDISLRAGDAVKVDPLVINFDSDAPSLTEEKFSFDLDNDGRSDQVSFVSKGSGFLALDANNDGVINNGSELFGPQSGNGFKDLALYDEDKNGWIDENDAIYDKLRIWTKDEEGNDELFAIGQKGIGAIYLGNVSTVFDLKDSQNQQQGDISRTGIFLRENGTAGTIQHINLAI